VGGGFPWESIFAVPLSSAALANLRAYPEPEIAFNNAVNQTYVLYNTGETIPGYPVTAAAGIHPIYNSPAIDRLEGTSSDLVIVSLHALYAWDNFGALIPGWPHIGPYPFYDGAAVADIDLDGHLEVVALSDSTLHVIDVNNAPNVVGESWPMYAHDPQRTGCSDCPEDIATSVETDPVGERIARVSFAAPSPNPVAGATQFSYAVPSRAVVSLEIFDLRGARVATILREEFGPGRKVLSWHGRNDHGAPLASGHYFARLRVRGPDVREELVRKLTILR
jgi:hypothetical protein